MSGKYTFYIRLNTTGSSIESVYNFSIATNAPGLVFTSSIGLVGGAYSSSIGHLEKAPMYVTGSVVTKSAGALNRHYALSGSWVASTTFTPYGAVNLEVIVA